MRCMVLILGALTLAGCKTTEQLVAEDDAKCLSYGVAKGSPPYVECRMRLETQRNHRNLVLMSAPGTALFVNSR